MRVKLLRPLGGRPGGSIIDQDTAAAEWLLSAGFAVAADDVEPVDELGPDTEPAPGSPSLGADEAASSARRGRRSPRTAPGRG
ncbi:hypothetical protein [Amycolatopsis sp. CB00013]|uniref:hypothetical protein n=1 Tax=Amycolatopsis sp. CB00013 TaxID=1703945 RepID=UPI00093A2A78|nr:hypothetical protein [Amycolatopsis sp. CB00013]OKK00607.1 hypothetical protein AMK34_02955 [Amycolatopsis sp. CB00013]